MAELIELFPDWDDENASVDEIFDRTLEAEEVQKNAKDALFQATLAHVKSVLENAPDNVKELSFAADDGLFALRGYPLDAIFGTFAFEVMFAEDSKYQYEIAVFFDLNEETEQIFSCGVLLRDAGDGVRSAWIDDKWVKEWNIHENGPCDCNLCDEKESCQSYLTRKRAQMQGELMYKAAKKVAKKYPGIPKLLNKYNAEMLIIPKEEEEFDG